MTVTILVATPHAPFGELLRMSLEDSGQYRVRLVLSAREARVAAGRVSFQLAILDSAIQDEPFLPLCKDLLSSQEGLRLVVIPPDNNPNHPALGGLLPHGYLSRPFYLPDLINTVSRLMSDRQSELRQSGDIPAAAALSVTLPPWLQEPLTLTNYLEKELAGTQALAGMVGAVGMEPGRGQLRASTGGLSGEAAEELASVVFRYWKCDEKTDLMRFIRLSADKRDHLVYATAITGDLVLILAYDTSAPLSLIRPQTKDVAQTLASLPPEGYSARAEAAAEPQPPSVAPEAAAPEAAAHEAAATDSTASAGSEDPAPFPPTSEPVDFAEASAPAAPLEQPPHTYTHLSAATPVPTDPLALRPAEDTERLPRQQEQSEPAEPAQPAEPASSQAQAGLYPVEPPDLFEEDLGPELDMINLAALLGSIPSPDPEGFSPNNNGWHVGRPASTAIPTLPGGLNGWEHVEGPEAPDLSAVELPEAGDLPEANELPEASVPFIRPDRPLADEVATDEAFLSLLHIPVEPGQDTPVQEPLPEANELPEANDLPQAGSLPQTNEDPPVVPAPAGPDSSAADWAYAWDEAAAPEELAAAPEDPAAPEELSAKGRAADQPPAADTRVPQPPEASPALWSAELPIWIGDDAAAQDGSSDEYSLPAPGFDQAIEPSSAQVPATRYPDEAPIDPLEDTRPRVVAAITQLNQLEPVSPALSLLNYTCVLIPRLPNHYLIGDMADRLSAWVAQICLAFGWRLEGIAVRPEYLQWSVQVAPAVSPGNLVRILRQRTSLHIFSAFPQFAAQNPSGDFWATGYLIVSGPQPPSAQLLRDYIEQTRKRQGVGD